MKNRNKTDHTRRGARCGQRKHRHLSGQRGEQPRVNISSSLNRGGEAERQESDPRAPADLTCTLVMVKSSQGPGTSATRHFEHVCRLEPITPLGRVFKCLHCPSRVSGRVFTIYVSTEKPHILPPGSH